MLAAACGSAPTTPPTPIAPQQVVEPQPPLPPTPPPTLGVTKILAFGDSMTEGVDSPSLPTPTLALTLALTPGRAQSYPFKLKALIEARYTAQTIEVLNAGLAGRQARDDRARFTDAMSEARPDLILLLEGANDLGAPLREGEGINARVTEVVGALEDLVRDAGFRSIPVMIGTLPPQRPGGPKAAGVAFLPRFNAAVIEMAGKKGAQVIDIAQLPVSMIGADGLHPSEAGYQRIAEIWLDAIKARFEQALQ
jgi:acyl-CoA thioesterase I